MDKGAFIQNGYTVEPGVGGSFIVVQGGMRWRSDGNLASMRGFTNWEQLVEWLRSEHEVNSTLDYAAKSDKIAS